MLSQSCIGTKSDRPPLLYLVHRVPYPPDKGDRIRAFHLLKFLSQHSSLHLACLADEPVPDEVVSTLRGYCQQLAIVRLPKILRWVRAFGSFASGRTVTEGAFSSPALRKIVCAWAREKPFQVVLASASSMVPYLQLPEVRRIPAVIDIVDVDSQKWFDYAGITRGPRAWLYKTEGQRLRTLERGLTNWARAVTLVTEAEAAIYRQVCPCGPIHAVTNGVDLDYFRPAPLASEASCVFTGALDYRPNVEGAVWFCNEVWGEIRRRWPEAKFYLVGRRPAPAVRRLAELPGVDLVGQVLDVRPHIARAGVAIVPLHVARGVQNKVLEALAMAKATIVSPQALAGLRASPDNDLIVARSTNEWIDGIESLWRDASLRQRLGLAGRRYVEENHDWNRCLAPFGPLLGLASTSQIEAGR
ncbi:MAG TPA: TIGR03087 family PEP-CTERM/XrtA system glycosyltransferase [Gemmataceae bacterium]|nr:TIGR03087 family PEP-CTERM/XrtA system glycosyltransferase [Gemmataceae bacterium]